MRPGIRIPSGCLSANRDVLRVYHTPEMQAVVADIADRFVNSAASAYGFTLRVATVGNPNWRAEGAHDDDADSDSVAGRAGLAIGEGERAAAGFRAEPADRLSGIQFAAAAGE